jgi:CxxC motif-containing protein (DUF1111 family)
MTTRIRLLGAIGTLFLAPALIVMAASESQDPGPRGGPAAAGGPLPGLTPGQLSAFMDGADDFNSSHSVDGSIRDADATGLGPTFNLENCGGCHAAPDIGGTSPTRNPQFESAFVAGAVNHIPSFLQRNGPVLEARFVVNSDGTPDGAVHNLFTIAGRSDAPGCHLGQPDFEAESRRGNLALRIPTPTFGDGLLENIPEEQILANKVSAQSEKAILGITGRENRNLQDGTITRFGWKAQNPSLMNFAGEAYNVEMGVTNEVFPNERSAACQFTPTPEDHPDFEGGVSGVQHFTDFMRLLAPAQAAEATASTVRGQQVFVSTGCAMCHTPTLKTRGSDIAALSNQFVNLYSDLLLHDMGRGLADRVSQGLATGNEFRTAPLWGIGQRLFFLHDGRTSDLKAAILAHESPGSEANAVIGLFKAQPAVDQQHLLNFLRAL